MTKSSTQTADVPSSGTLIPSATAIILHTVSKQEQFKVLLLKRNNKLKTHGGSWVFPGGKFDHKDYEQQDLSNTNRTYHLLSESECTLTAKVAAIRETYEEANIQLNPDSLKLCSRWLTPETMTRRFDAFFFIAESRDDTVAIDGSEIHDYQWISPQDALAQQRRGEIILPPPTFVSLNYLSGFEHAVSAITEMTQKPIHFRPKLVNTDNGFCSLYEEDAGYLKADPNIEGSQHRLLLENGQYRYTKNAV